MKFRVKEAVEAKATDMLRKVSENQIQHLFDQRKVCMNQFKGKGERTSKVMELTLQWFD